MTTGPKARAVPILLAAAALLYLLTLWRLEPNAFWIVDNGNKYLQLRGIVSSGYTDVALVPPERAEPRLDPAFDFNPLPPPFSHVSEGRLYSQYLPYFALLSSLPWRLVGTWGLYLLPIAGALAALGAVAALARRLDDDPLLPPLAVSLVAVATPVWFYAVVFWEHSLALALLLWCHVLLLDALAEKPATEASVRRAGLLGLLLGATLFLREEALLFVPLFGLPLLRRRLGRAAVAAGVGLLAAAVPLLMLNQALLGNALGLHASSNLASLGEHLSSRPTVFYRLLLAGGIGPVGSLLLVGPLLLLFAARPRLSGRGWVVAGGGWALLLSLIFLLALLTAPSPILQLLDSNSLLPVAPFVALAALRPAERNGRERARDALWLSALGFAVLYALAAPAISSQGIHWGCRFLLPLYPLLSVLAAHNLVAWWRQQSPGLAATLLLAASLAASVGSQIYGLGLLHDKKELTRRGDDLLLALPEEVLVTGLWWAPQTFHRTYLEKTFFVVDSPAELEELRRRLRQRGAESLLLLTRERGTEGEEIARIEDADLGFFSFSVLRIAP